MTAHESLTVSGESRFLSLDTGDPFPSGLFASTESDSPDADEGGMVTVTAPVIKIENRGEIASETFNPADGGALLVSTDHLVIDNGEITTKPDGAGDGGRIEVVAGNVELRNGGLISSSSTERLVPAGSGGDAGNVMITTGRDLVLDRAAEISTEVPESGMSAGGQIVISAGRLIDVNRSNITTNGVIPTPGSSLLTVAAPLVAINRSTVTSLTAAGTPVPGAGVVEITGDPLLISADSLVAATSSLQLSGLDEQLGSQLVVLAATPLDADALLREPCALRQDVGASSFTGVGRGGLPAAPDRPLGSAYRQPVEVGATSTRPAALMLAISCSNAD